MNIKTIIISGIIGLVWAFSSSGFIWASGFAGVSVSLIGYVLALPTTLSWFIERALVLLLIAFNLDYAFLTTIQAHYFFWYVVPFILGTLLVYLFLEMIKKLSGNIRSAPRSS